ELFKVVLQRALLAEKGLQGIWVCGFPPDVGGRLYLQHWKLDANSGAKLAGIPTLRFVFLPGSRYIFRPDSGFPVVAFRRRIRGSPKSPGPVVDVAIHPVDF